LIDFWAWQLLDEPGYEGRPLRAHEPVHARDPFGPEMYERWLELFEGAVDAGFAGPGAERAKNRARRMAAALARILEPVDSPS
jgi:hemoglobin